MKEGQTESLRIHSFMSVSASLKQCLASRGVQITQITLTLSQTPDS